MEKKFEIRTRKHVRDYLKKQVETFSKKIDYSEIIINPFFYALMKEQLELQTKEKFSRSLIFQGKIKGLTGTFGTKLQQSLRICHPDTFVDHFIAYLHFINNCLKSKIVFMVKKCPQNFLGKSPDEKKIFQVSISRFMFKIESYMEKKVLHITHEFF